VSMVVEETSGVESDGVESGGVESGGNLESFGMKREMTQGEILFIGSKISAVVL
jgi:hypothetical protein